MKIDQLYFLATGGGITFGGGEPSMYPDFIVRFREICGPEWNLTLETSLNVPADNIRRLSSVINQFIIDIKDTNDEMEIFTCSYEDEAVMTRFWNQMHAA